jgi:class 3 adenylate cyclase
MPSVRRLTAILAADVAGYSRLMGVDEEGTHQRLKNIARPVRVYRIPIAEQTAGQAPARHRHNI